VAEAVKIFILIISLRANFTEAYQNLISNCHCIFSWRWRKHIYWQLPNRICDVSSTKQSSFMV